MKKHGCLPGDEGFISGYFLAALIIVCALNTVILQNLNLRAQTIRNIDREQLYLAAESAALAELRCRLENSEELDSPYIVTVYGPQPEIMRVTLNNGSVYDYETDRNENGQSLLQ